MKRLRVKQVPCTFAFFVCLLWYFRVVFGEPVESNAPVASNSDTDSGRVTYDQRQTGKYNIHVSIKDVAIIEVDQNGIEDISYGDDDYYYDEGHLTVNPIQLKPIAALNQPNTTSTTTPITLSFNQDASPIITPPTTTISSNQTYSPNLLADIAATHAINNENDSPQTLNAATSTIPTILPKKRTQNVVILDTQSLTHNSPTSTHKPAMSTTVQTEETNARSKEIPLNSMFKAAMQHMNQPANTPQTHARPHLRFADSNPDEIVSNDPHKMQENDSKIYKFKSRRTHKQGQAAGRTPGAAVAYPVPHLRGISTRRCRAHQYRDASGDCRAKRSPSILKKLFSMLVTLPFPNERAIDDRDDE